MSKRQRSGDDFFLLSHCHGQDVDLIKEILLRLPVKSLLRFKMVSKSWCTLIESPFFIDLHTTFKSSSSCSNKQQQFGSFIFLASFYKYVESESPDFVSSSSGGPCVSFQFLKEDSVVMLSVDSSSLSRSSGSSSDGGGCCCLWSTTTATTTDSSKKKKKNDDDDDQEEEEEEQLVFKVGSLGFSDYNMFFSEFSHKNIVGSCNGLVCLYDITLDEVYLWNPAIRQVKILPKAIEIVGEWFPRHLVGFGFDVETKDYKVVRLTTAFRSKYYRTASPPIDCLCRVQVYSSSTDSWSLLEGITCLPGFPFFSSYPTTTELVCLNGSCFFLAYFFRNKQQLCFPENDRFLISFNLTNYVITPIQLPDHHRHQKLYLSCLGGDNNNNNKLALFTVGPKLPPRGDYYYLDIYALPSPTTPEYSSSYHPKIYQPPRGIFYSQICCCEDYNVWVLDEHVSSSNSVNKESWRQLHSFQIEHQTPDQQSSPSCISNDGEFVLLGTAYSIGLGKNMKLCNLVTKEVTKDFLSCDQVMSKAYAYKPSLVKCWAAASSSQQQQQQPMQ